MRHGGEDMGSKDQMLGLLQSRCNFLAKINFVPLVTLDPVIVNFAEAKRFSPTERLRVSPCVPSSAQCTELILPAILLVVQAGETVSQKSLLWCPALCHSAERCKNKQNKLLRMNLKM